MKIDRENAEDGMKKEMRGFASQDVIGFDLNKTNSKIKYHSALRVSYRLFDWNNLTKVPHNGTQLTLSYCSPHVLIRAPLLSSSFTICSWPPAEAACSALGPLSTRA